MPSSEEAAECVEGRLGMRGEGETSVFSVDARGPRRREAPGDGSILSGALVVESLRRRWVVSEYQDEVY